MSLVQTAQGSCGHLQQTPVLLVSAHRACTRLLLCCQTFPAMKRAARSAQPMFLMSPWQILRCAASRPQRSGCSSSASCTSFQPHITGPHRLALILHGSIMVKAGPCITSSVYACALCMRGPGRASHLYQAHVLLTQTASVQRIGELQAGGVRDLPSLRQARLRSELCCGGTQWAQNCRGSHICRLRLPYLHHIAEPVPAGASQYTIGLHGLISTHKH